MNKKIIIIVTTVLFVTLLVLFIIFRSNTVKLEGGTRAINNVVFTKSKVIKKGKDYYYKGYILIDKEINIKRVDIIIKDRNGNVLDTLDYKIKDIKPNKKKKIYIKSSKNLKLAKKVSFSVYK